MKEVALSAIGRDRPGIVAAVTKVLLDLGCNLADSSMAILGDQFAMVLLVELPDDLSIQVLDDSLRQAVEPLDLVTQVREAGHAHSSIGTEPYVISMYGADKPGIVHSVAEALAETGANITDLTSHLAGNIYTMVLDIDVPNEVDIEDLKRSLTATATRLEVDLTIRRAELEQL